jgi:hypothetical protein
LLQPYKPDLNEEYDEEQTYNYETFGNESSNNEQSNFSATVTSTSTMRNTNEQNDDDNDDEDDYSTYTSSYSGYYDCVEARYCEDGKWRVYYINGGFWDVSPPELVGVIDDSGFVQLTNGKWTTIEQIQKHAHAWGTNFSNFKNDDSKVTTERPDQVVPTGEPTPLVGGQLRKENSLALANGGIEYQKVSPDNFNRAVELGDGAKLLLEQALMFYGFAPFNLATGVTGLAIAATVSQCDRITVRVGTTDAGVEVAALGKANKSNVVKTAVPKIEQGATIARVTVKSDHEVISAYSGTNAATIKTTVQGLEKAKSGYPKFAEAIHTELLAEAQATGAAEIETENFIRAIFRYADSMTPPPGTKNIGTWKHTQAKKLITAYQAKYQAFQGLEVEQALLGGKDVRNVTKSGYSRFDVLDPATGIIYDYKFTMPSNPLKAKMSPTRVEYYLKNASSSYTKVVEVHP